MKIPLILASTSLALCSISFGQDIGLSLLFQNSQANPIRLVGDHRRFLQEIDIASTAAPSSVDEGIDPIKLSGEFASLDWTGIQLVEEDVRPNGLGQFTRQRFYRGAQWMKVASSFTVQAVNSNNVVVGQSLSAYAGTDDQRTAADDGFVRRFIARQVAFNCPTATDCTGATFIAQGLVQWRHNVHSADLARDLAHSAAKFRLIWSLQPNLPREVAVTHAEDEDFPFTYGFAPSIAPVNAPANGQFYVPGENVTLRVTLRDGSGNRLHPLGSMATLADVLSGADTSGIRYFNPSLIPTLYYAYKHREANTTVGLLGPAHKLKVSNHAVSIFDFFLPQVPTSTVADGGWTGLAYTIPPPLVALGVLPPTTPVPDTVAFTIPADAEAGTYIASYKGRREFGGEALNRGATADIKVGTNSPAPYVSATGGCNTCHQNASAIASVLHGIGDRRACFGCHTGLSFEPDNPLDIRVHTVHDRSRRFNSSMQNCAQCHLTPPAGPARGLLP